MNKQFDYVPRFEEYPLSGLSHATHNLGNLMLARQNSINTAELYKKEQDDLGLDNATKNLRILGLMEGDAASALAQLQEAVGLNEKIQEPGGLAQPLALIALIFHGDEQAEARDAAYAATLVQAKASGSPAVWEYVENIGKAWLA
jgi:hypothetical protein